MREYVKFDGHTVFVRLILRFRRSMIDPASDIPVDDFNFKAKKRGCKTENGM